MDIERTTAELLEILRAKWPEHHGQIVYLRFPEVARMLGFVTWEDAKPEMHRLERGGYVQNIYSGGLNQVWPIFLTEDLKC